MDLNQVVQIINSVGFPIVCVIALFQQNVKQDERNYKQIDDLKQVIENNNKVLNELVIEIKSNFKRGEK